MKPLLIVTAAMFTAVSFNAYANRIPNLSMTPNEMYRQGLHRNTPKTNNTNNNTTTNSYPTNQFNSNIYSQPAGMSPSTAPYPAAPNIANNYMEGFCDPQFKPLISRSSSYAVIAQCLARMREQACSLYRTLPEDAKKSVDASINCLSTHAGGGGLTEAADGTLQPEAASTATPECYQADAERLEMVKRYWKEQQIAYGLVFIPELTMDNSGSCIGGR